MGKLEAKEVMEIVEHGHLSHNLSPGILIIQNTVWTPLPSFKRGEPIHDL